MSKFTFIDNKVQLLVDTLVLLVLLCLLGVYTQRAQSARLEQSLAESQLAAASVQASDDAAIHFKIQVQEWKNLLLRGQDQASYARYLESFQREHLAVEAALDKSRTAFEKLGLDTAPVH